ncbi:diaminopimelate epimerase [Allosaccharopolyspora coralli]|uniref:Diaminopimelate epimerase n=1 Tax=Allosaccharopolyspora coralli TaxID=2665642 RepID=A0A5Q3QBU1_9PSEU|nr:diaminopimelate epimerase [Allosaccharopolyspora coralli]
MSDPPAGPRYAKGHGTENDFVLLPDPDGELKLTGARVRALCDRRRGLGADGVLRVVRAGGLDEELPGGTNPDTWFMDYRNADGSVAEMCGNGVRVFARYLVETGLAARGDLPVGTRAGVRATHVHDDGRVTVDMGPVTAHGLSTTRADGHEFSGLVIDVGNPHLACVTELDVRTLEITAAPTHDPAVFPHGVNVEFVQPVGPDRVRMRVHERGVGETRSCGTGTVAATLAGLRAAGADTGLRTVEVPGGTVEVEVTPTTSTLTGPAVLVAHGRLDADWWERYESD